MSRLIGDLLILVAMILGVRLVAETGMDWSFVPGLLAAMPSPDMPARIDLPSFILGAIAGLFVGLLATVRWSSLWTNSKHWFARHSTRFSYIGLSFGFALVLLYY